MQGIMVGQCPGELWDCPGHRVDPGGLHCQRVLSWFKEVNTLLSSPPGAVLVAVPL